MITNFLIQIRRIPLSVRLTILFSISAIIILFPLLVNPTFVSGPDIGTHIFNAQQFSSDMQQGSLYPRWIGKYYAGYGAPIGVAYSPLTYSSIGLLGLVGIHTLPALKIILWLSLALSGLFMYKLVEYFGSSTSAIVAAIVYQAAPYRMLDLYERTAIPEFLAFFWLPLITFLVVKWVREHKFHDLVFLSVSFAGLIFTHFMIAYIYGFFLVGLFIYVIVTEQASNRLRVGLGIIVSLGFSVALSAVYILPAIFESQYMYTEWLAPGVNIWGDYRNNFLFNAQIYQGTQFSNMYVENNFISVGTGLLILIGVTALIMISRVWKQRKPEVRRMVVYMGIVAAVSVFMSLSISAPLWSILPRAENIAFPWRWQTLTVFAVSFLAGDLFNNLLKINVSEDQRHILQRRLVIGFVSLCFASVLIFSFYIVRRSRNSFMSQDTLDELTDVKPVSPNNYGWVFDEPYRPHAAEKFDYSNDSAISAPIKTDPATTVKISEWHSEQRVFSVSAANATDVNIRTFWFPGWTAWVNDKPTDIAIKPEDGTMLLSLPAGDSAVKVEFENTPVRNLGLIVSLAAGLTLLCAGLISIGFSFRKKQFSVAPTPTASAAA